LKRLLGLQLLTHPRLKSWVFAFIWPAETVSTVSHRVAVE
jgi:hypothetical protein